MSSTYDAKNSYLLSFAADFDNPNVDRAKMRALIEHEVEQFLSKNKLNRTCE